MNDIITDFSTYMRVIKNRSEKTVEQYIQDLTLFFKYYVAAKQKTDLSNEALQAMSTPIVTENLVKEISESTIYSFLMFAADTRGNNARTRARKLSSLKSFFSYCSSKIKIIETNPTANIESPKTGKELPKYLTAEESLNLLNTISSDSSNKNGVRDYAMITLFLNCGMRLSELTGLNIDSFDPDFSIVKVNGKGSKERIIYLNDACKSALKEYVEVRHTILPKPEAKNAFFISRIGKRISPKTVQWSVYKYLNAAGLGYKNCSVHKLRHTAATLMYQSGNVDIRVLKDILGHEQLNTTQIYTHLSDDSMKKAVYSNPLSHVKKSKST